MKNEKIDEIWQAFEKAIEERFLADGKLPHYPEKDSHGELATNDPAARLSYDLSQLWHASVFPVNSFLKVLAELGLLERFEISSTGIDASSGRGGITIKEYHADFPMIAMRLSARNRGISASLLFADRTIWRQSIHYCRDDLEKQLAIEFDYLVYELYLQATVVVSNFAASVTEAVAKPEAA